MVEIMLYNVVDGKLTDGFIGEKKFFYWVVRCYMDQWVNRSDHRASDADRNYRREK